MSTTESCREILEPLADGLTRTWTLDEVLWEGDTEFQHLVIAKTEQGISLFCDNDRQSTEFSQLVYHEALMVPAFLLADRVDAVLIVGSSEGVASELAAAAGASKVDHVDIDRECVRRCAELLPYGYTPESLAQAESGQDTIRLTYADGFQFLADRYAEGTRYDIVVVDLPDEHDDADAQHNRLYGVDFLQRCKELLAPGGVVAYQAGCPTVWRNATLLRSWRRFHEVFATTAYYGSDEHEWAFLFGCADDLGALPTSLMVDQLPRCEYTPETIDAAALLGNTVPPHTLRHS